MSIKKFSSKPRVGPNKKMLDIFEEKFELHPKCIAVAENPEKYPLSFELLDFLSRKESQLLNSECNRKTMASPIGPHSTQEVLIKVVAAYKSGLLPFPDTPLADIEHPVGPRDSLVQVTPFVSAFDIWTLHRWVRADAHVTLLPQEMTADPADVADVLQENQATVACLPEKILADLLELARKNQRVERIITDLQTITCSNHDAPPPGSDHHPHLADGNCQKYLTKEIIPFGLTKTEMSVARMVAEGKTNKEISLDLVLSIHTVGSHVRSAFTKVGVNNRVALARAIIFHECEATLAPHIVHPS